LHDYPPYSDMTAGMAFHHRQHQHFSTYSFVKGYLLNNGQFLPIGKMIETGAKIQINNNFTVGSQEILESWYSPLREFESLVSPS
jgi:hypothetical protein